MAQVITTVLFIRHESRGANEEAVPMNCLTDDARKRAFRSGQRLAALGHHITAAYSSPTGRTVETLLCNLAGNRPDKGPIPLNGVDEAFGDMLMGAYPYTEDEKQAIIAAAKAAGVSAEEYLMTAPEHAKKAAARGEEGRAALLELVRKHEGGVIAIASHGGSRIEVTIKAVLGEALKHVLPNGVPMVEPGGIIVMKFGGDMPPSVEYLGNLGLAEQPSRTTA